MKKFKISILLSIIAVVACIIAMNSCSKQETEVKQDEPCVTQADKAFVSKIVNFKQKVDYIRENPHYKSGESMEVDSVVWYFEALFNTVYAYPDEIYGKTITDTAILQVDIDAEGFVSYNDIVSKYDELYDVVRDYYINSGIEDKGFVLLDLELIEVNSNQATIELRSITGESNNSNSDYNPFNENDWWLYGYLWGDCDYNNPGTDAAEQIEEAIMAHRPIYIPCPGCYYVYSDIDDVELEGFEYQNTNGEYLIFYIMKENGDFTSDDKCLAPDEMNFHFHGEETIIYDTLEPELEKRFMSCELEGLQDNDIYGNPRIRHDNILTFGIPHLIQPEYTTIIKEPLD